jgi:DNA-binding transcriptional ArsR family regulator
MQEHLRTFKAEFCRALAHPTRIAILELLENGELNAGSLTRAINLEQATVSQHLTVLRAKGIVTTRKSGNQVFYRLRDPVIGQVLRLLRQYFHNNLTEALGLLEEMTSESVGHMRREG